MSDSKMFSTAVAPVRFVESLRDLIVRGVLSAGVHLGQADLRRRFGVSGVLVREGLKQLSAEGIVLHDPHRGFFVLNLSSVEAGQLYRIRHLLESDLLCSIEWPSEAEFARIQAFFNGMNSALLLRNGAKFTTEHFAFHDAIFELSPKKTHLKEVRRLLRLTDRYGSLAWDGRGWRPHADPERQLLNALAIRDRKQLLSVFEAKLADLERRVLEHLRLRGL